MSELRSNLTSTTPVVLGLVQRLLNPAITVVTLLAVVAWYGIELTGGYEALAIIAFLLAAYAFDDVDVTQPASRAGIRAQGASLFLSWLELAFILLFLGYATGYVVLYDPQVLITWLLITPVLIIAVQSIASRAYDQALRAPENIRKAVIAGVNDLGRYVAQEVTANRSLGLQFTGFFDDRDISRLGSLDQGRLLGRLDALAHFVKQHNIDVIYITLPITRQERLQVLLDGLRDTTASIYFVPDIFIFDLIQARMDRVGGVPVLAVCETPFVGINGVVKRISDLIFALLILAVISPLLLVIAILVKLGSPGPILFKQRRYGLDGREIEVYKFRSMTVLEDGATIRQATANDTRVTRIGRVLRKYSLDELPQFVNVLQGRMSIVGPRPHAVAHNEEYRKLIQGYMLRHKVKPGITGWAQINGLRGETETLDKMKARIEYDLDYLRNWSLALDMKIIAKTVAVVFRDGNAY